MLIAMRSSTSSTAPMADFSSASPSRAKPGPKVWTIAAVPCSSLIRSPPRKAASPIQVCGEPQTGCHPRMIQTGHLFVTFREFGDRYYKRHDEYKPGRVYVGDKTTPVE